MIPPVPNRLLDLRPEIGQVACSFQWDLVNRQGDKLGSLHPQVGATLSNDTSATVYRTARGVQLRESEWRDIDVFDSAVRPWMLLEDGTRWPLGLLLFTANPITEGTLESPMSTSLVDQRAVLGEEMPHSYGIPDGGLIHRALVEVVELYGFHDYEIADMGDRVGGGPVSWPPDARGITILESLAQRSGCHPPYFDNNGRLVIRPFVTLQHGVGHQYPRRDGRIKQGTLTSSSNLLEAVNAYRVISSGSTQNEISAVAYVDPALPHSRERTGRTKTHTTRKQGLPDTAACLRVADAMARQDAASYATAEFESVPDPRHDTFEFAELDGEVYREVAWSMMMQPGGSHSHRLAKATLMEDQ